VCAGEPSAARENQRLRVDALWVTDAIDENRRLRGLLALRNGCP